MGFFRDDDDDRYTGQTGDPVHDEIYGWDMGSVSDSDYDYDSKPNHSRDKNSRHESSRKKTDEEILDNILAGMFLPVSRWAALKNKLLSFYNSRDCTNLTVEGGYGEYIFKFTRQNRYIKTVDEFYYYPDMDFERIFQDFYTTHDYENLLKDPKFKRMISATGLEFVRCSGGYVTRYLMAEDEIIMKDELDICVIFKSDSPIETCYALDLDKMELTDKLF